MLKVIARKLRARRHRNVERNELVWAVVPPSVAGPQQGPSLSSSPTMTPTTLEMLRGERVRAEVEVVVVRLAVVNNDLRRRRHQPTKGGLRGVAPV